MKATRYQVPYFTIYLIDIINKEHIIVSNEFVNITINNQLFQAYNIDGEEFIIKSVNNNIHCSPQNKSYSNLIRFQIQPDYEFIDNYRSDWTEDNCTIYILLVIFFFIKNVILSNLKVI